LAFKVYLHEQWFCVALCRATHSSDQFKSGDAALRNTELHKNNCLCK
jgi:hypothetical protein